MDAKDLVNLSQEELLLKEKGLKEELARLNQERYGGRVDKPHRFSLIKKDIAKIKTILRQKQERPNGQD
ncbi:MAG: 50S ribosomal protein L29 [Candidatus Omnitrophota bacterium]|jgi:large subunit ribosomal protein L29